MTIAIGLLIIAVIFLVWKLNDILGTQQGRVPEVGSGRASDDQRGPSVQSGDNTLNHDDNANSMSPLAEDMVVDGADFDALSSELA